jgi:hypothetical protein
MYEAKASIQGDPHLRVHVELQGVLCDGHGVVADVTPGDVHDSQAAGLDGGGHGGHKAGGGVGGARAAEPVEMHVRPRVAHCRGPRVQALGISGLGFVIWGFKAFWYRVQGFFIFWFRVEGFSVKSFRVSGFKVLGI